MNSPSESVRAWAQRLIAVEAARDNISDAGGQALARVCEKLRISLTPFVGPDGFAALLRRAVALAREEVPALIYTRVTTDGRLETIEGFHSSTLQETEAGVIVTAHLLSLLVTFIGESLTLRLMGKAFPDADSNDGRT